MPTYARKVFTRSKEKYLCNFLNLLVFSYNSCYNEYKDYSGCSPLKNYIIGVINYDSFRGNSLV